jgi:predicted permease
MGMLWRLRNLWRRERIEREIYAELEVHINMRMQDNIAAGMSPDRARREALLRFGNPVVARERALGAVAALEMDNLWRDLRHASRHLRKSPGFAVTAMVTLALGIGANTAIFSIVEAVLLRPLPYQHPERLVVVWQADAAHRKTGAYFNSYRAFQAWQQNSRSFEKMAALSWADGSHAGPILWHGKPLNILMIPASVDFFATLGVSQQMGRTFTQGDLNNSCTLVLSHSFWQQKLGAPRDIVGQSLNFGSSPCQVVGVMPRSFSFYPVQTDAWTLITPASGFVKNPWDTMTGVFGILKPGVTRAAAGAELTAIQARMAPEIPAHLAIMRSWAPDVIDLHENFTWLAGRNLRQGLWLLLGASGLILLMACVNVGNLLLGRSIEREREMAVRAALGSGQRRLIGQAIIESLLLALCGTLAGVALAVALLHWFRASSPIELPPGSVIAIDWRVLVFATTAGTFSALAFGLFPAWRGSRVDPNTALKAGGQAQGQTASAQRAARTLVVVQVALSMVLLVVAGLLSESLWKLASTDVGYRTDHLFTAEVNLPGDRYRDAGARSRLATELAATLGSLPQVQAVALGSRFLPMGGSDALAVEGRPGLEKSSSTATEQAVSANFFSTLRIPVAEGRLFDARDQASTQPVAIINEALVKRFFPGTNPLGHAIKLGRTEDPSVPWLNVVGIVRNVKTTTVFQEMGYVETPVVYRPLSQTAPATLALMIAVEGRPLDFAGEIERRLTTLDPQLALINVDGMRAMRSSGLSQPRFRTVLFGSFALLALTLALVGLYGVLSQMILRRRRDIGVRMALGADRERILWSILSQACVMTVTGIAIGTACAGVVVRFLHGFLYGIVSHGIGDFACAAGAMLAAAVAAAWRPARRAASVEPMQALRSE